jgi:RTX calcium-binding nonapeptide repeat (4 copies)
MPLAGVFTAREHNYSERNTMKNVIRFKESRSVRPVWRAASAVAVAAAVAGAAAIVAGPADAAPATKAGEASQVLKKGEVNAPTLEDGVLTIEGTNSADKIALRLQAGQPGILQVDVGDDASADFDFERADVATIAVNAGNGDDFVRIDESNGLFTDIPATIDGGNGDDDLVGGSGAGTLSGNNGDDTLLGGSGVETLDGGNGADSIDGNKGNDVAFMGNGGDTFVWDPGDGSDTVEGQNGVDTMVFNGAGIAEQIDLTANGNRLRLVRNVGSVTMDTDGVERVDVNALGGGDVVTVNDLSGTDVTTVNVDLAGTLGAGDGDNQPDQIVANATDGDDTINVSGDAAGVNVTGLAATVRVLHAEAANDRLEINTRAGTDTVDSGRLTAGVIQLVVDGALVQ